MQYGGARYSTVRIKAMSDKKQPLDYADRSGLLKDDSWQDQNKESYGQIAKYLLFIIASAGFGFVLMVGVMA